MRREIIVLVAAVLLGAGCAPATTPGRAGTAKGVSLSPKSFASGDFQEFFAKAKEAGSVVTWAGDWLELEKTDGGGPAVVAGLAKVYGYAPVIQAQAFEASTGKLLRPLDQATQTRYRESLVAFVRKHRPPFVGIGVEVNVLAEKSPRDFETFVALFAATAKAVKEASPATKVFTSFQLERLKGLRGGLFGGKNDETKDDWALLRKFPDADLVAFTTYPGIIYKDPEDIPDDYYSSIAGKTTKPVAFTEIGWPAATPAKSWESDPEEQARFVRRFRELSAALRPVLAVWSFLYNQAIPQPFTSMGLIAADGTERPAFAAWRE